MSAAPSPPGSHRHVWIVNHYADIPSKDGGSARHLDLARYLPGYGWSASLIVASTTYPQGKQAMKGFRLRKITEELGVPVLWVRTMAYGTSTALRFFGMVIFALMTLMPGMTRGVRRPHRAGLLGALGWPGRQFWGEVPPSGCVN